LPGGRRLRACFGFGYDDLLVVQAEDGRGVLVEATPEAHREVASVQALDGKTWNYPALAGRQL
jgi:hypothetical protein